MRGTVGKFDVEIIEDLDLRIVRVLSPVTHDEIQSLMDSEFNKRQTLNLVWDFAPGSFQLLSTDDLKHLLTARLDRVRKRVGGHTVMIAHEVTEFTLLKWYKEFAQTLGVREVQFHIAPSMEEALSLIRVDQR